MEKKKGSINKILILVLILVFVIVLVIGFLVLISPKKVPVIINNETKNQTAEQNGTIIPLAIEEVNISFDKFLKFTIKATNPQYKKGQDIIIQYTLENTKNETLVIPENVVNGIEIKNAGGKILDYSGNGTEEGVKVLKDSVSLSSLQKITGSFVIKGDDYDFFIIGSASEGYYNTVSAYIGDVNSNRLILRMILI